MRVEQIDQKPHRQSQPHDSVQYNRHAFIPLVVLQSFPFFAWFTRLFGYRLLRLYAPRRTRLDRLFTRLRDEGLYDAELKPDP